MKKKRIIILSSIGIIAIASAIGIGSRYANKQQVTDNNNEAVLQESQDPVTVNINSAEPSEMPEPTSEITAQPEKSIPLEQKNVPIPAKPTAKPSPPKSTGSYTNPDSPPAYNEKETVKEPSKETPPPPKENTNGKMYVEGFGYVDIGGPNQGGIADAEGDINKQIGSMD